MVDKNEKTKTVEIPEQLHREIKIFAAEQGAPLKVIVRENLRMNMRMLKAATWLVNSFGVGETIRYAPLLWLEAAYRELRQRKYPDSEDLKAINNVIKKVACFLGVSLKEGGRK